MAQIGPMSIAPQPALGGNGAPPVSLAQLRRAHAELRHAIGTDEAFDAVLRAQADEQRDRRAQMKARLGDLAAQIAAAEAREASDG